jgi:hypothetical protein
MSFSPTLLLLPYLVFIIIFALLGAFALYRLIRFGTPSGGSWLMIVIFALGTILVISLTLWQLNSTDWTNIVPVNLTPSAIPQL